MGMFGNSKLEATQEALRRARSNAAKWRATAEEQRGEMRKLLAEHARKDELATFNLTECRKLYDTTRAQLITSQKKLQVLERRLQLEQAEVSAADELVAKLQQERGELAAELNATGYKLRRLEAREAIGTRKLPDGTQVTLAMFAQHTRLRAAKLDTKLRLRSMELGELRKSVAMLEEHNAKLQEREQRAQRQLQSVAAGARELQRQLDARDGDLLEAARQIESLREEHALRTTELAQTERELAECRAAADRPEPADMRRMVQEDLQRRVDAGTMTLAEARDAVRVQP